LRVRPYHASEGIVAEVDEGELNARINRREDRLDHVAPDLNRRVGVPLDGFSATVHLPMSCERIQKEGVPLGVCPAAL
jgi:hypothetical protein